MEHSRLSSLLWVVAAVISVALLLFNIAGLWPFIEFVFVSLLSIICWLKYFHKPLPEQNAALPFYILSIALFIILNAIRFASGYASFIQSNYPGFFKQGMALDYTAWFIILVCFPASVMLFGAYSLAKRTTAGFFFGCWAFFYNIAESLLQFKVELGSISTYKHEYFLAVFAAMVLFLLSAYGIMRLIKPNGEMIAANTELALPTKRKVNLWSALFVTLVIIYGVTLCTQAGILPVGVIAGSMMGGMIGWRKTTAMAPADPYKLVPLYLLLQALFYVHVGEETITHFNRGIAAITGHSWSDKEFNYFIAFLGPVIWVFAAWSLWKRQAFGNFILWFMIVGMILGEPTHVLVFPVVRMFKQGVGYEYFSGMYTALFPMVPAIIALVVIIKDHKAQKAHHA
ncbi:MAG: hypothetical protein JSS96_07220 [Bacteroidetes bacterium]|nr:hypothetical protein [Bacteroidota bacterium]